MSVAGVPPLVSIHNRQFTTTNLCLDCLNFEHNGNRQVRFHQKICYPLLSGDSVSKTKEDNCFHNLRNEEMGAKLLCD